MPRRKKTPRSASLGKMIVPLYERPVLKFLAWAEGHALLATLIYGPPFGLDATQRAKLSAQDLAVLRSLWEELRIEILEAQAQYGPDKRPWGCRFDIRSETNANAQDKNT